MRTKKRNRRAELSAFGGVLLALFLAPSAWAVDCNSFKVWSFNIRFDNGSVFCASDCDNDWYKGELTSGRRNVAKAYLQGYDPDIFGLQEIKNSGPVPGFVVSQLQDVAGWFPGHNYYAQDRGDGEHCAIFYRSNRFDRLGAGTFWLSCTPDVQSKHPLETNNFRITSWVLLRDTYTTDEFFVFNNHWPLNSTARDYAAALIRERVHQMAGGFPAILLGDFNCDELSSPFNILIGTNAYPGSAECTNPQPVSQQDLSLVNSYREAVPVWDGEERTYHDFSGNTFGKRIDHVLNTRDDFAAFTAAVRRDTYAGGCTNAGCYPSDHYAVEVQFHVLLQNVQVDLQQLDALCELGTEALPFNTIAEAVNVVKSNGTITLRNTSGNAAVTINPIRGPVTITSIGGPSIVGK
ncbi:MAG: endonuclease/exonuclease/phosphatase family protein [Verrucomicrobia subdivision 3 bacterium]|nr:endonuclease/exonuclease/phosphatase family protein [Verrucomicrobiota bacterium]MCC6820872.1 endonuclease/exonuclease/phosphatase family protein [Limisphaerales bacterium]